MSSSRLRVKPLVYAAKSTAPQSPALLTKWKALAVTLSLVTALLLLWKFAPSLAKPAQAQQPTSSIAALPDSSLPEIVSPTQTLLKQPEEIQQVDVKGHWVRADQLKQGDTVVMPNGRQLAVKNIDYQTETVTGTKEKRVPIQPHEETTLELDLSQGGDAFDETLIVPATHETLLTDGTFKSAKQLKPGDKVHLSGDNIGLVKKAESKMYTPPPPQTPDAQGNVISRVIGTTKRMASRMLYLHTESEVVSTTPEHPFSVEGKGWVQAGHLQHGDRIQTESGKLITVDSIEVKNEKKIVYNLEVEGTHNFFVGKDKLLVHNGGDCVPTLNPFKGKTASEIDELLRAKGYSPRGPDPVNGLGGYVNPRTGRSIHIDPANSFGEPPHVDINRLRDYKGPLPKRKYPFGHGEE